MGVFFMKTEKHVKKLFPHFYKTQVTDVVSKMHGPGTYIAVTLYLILMFFKIAKKNLELHRHSKVFVRCFLAVLWLKTYGLFKGEKTDGAWYTNYSYQSFLLKSGLTLIS